MMTKMNDGKPVATRKLCVDDIVREPITRRMVRISDFSRGDDFTGIIGTDMEIGGRVVFTVPTASRRMVYGD